jgi:hypothetical protein
MGGKDVYCAICGGPLSTPWWNPPRPEETAAVVAHLKKVRAKEEKGKQAKEDENGEAQDNNKGMLDKDDQIQPHLLREYDPRIFPSHHDERLNWLSRFRVVSDVPEEYGKTVPE